MDTRKSWQEIANERTTVVSNNDYYETIQFQDAVILPNSPNGEKTFRNFAGAKDRYGSTAIRFNVVVPESAVQALLGMGYYVRHSSRGSDEEPQDLYFLQVKVNPDPAKGRSDLSPEFVESITPHLYLVTTWNGKQSVHELEEPLFGTLDSAYITTADIVIRPNKLDSPTSKGNTKTAWLVGKNYFVTEKRGEIQSSSRYDDVEAEAFA